MSYPNSYVTLQIRVPAGDHQEASLVARSEEFRGQIEAMGFDCQLMYFNSGTGIAKYDGQEIL